MFNHIMIGGNDIEESKKFYDSILGVLGYNKGFIDEKGRCVYKGNGSLFIITKPLDGKPATHGNGTTLGFAIDSPELVDAFHKAGVENGGTPCEDPPGFRRGYYLCYLRDPSNNKICGVYK